MLHKLKVKFCSPKIDTKNSCFR